MKISVSQENLKQALGLSERATSRTSQLPILNNILLRTEHGRLKVSATNLEIGVHCRIGAKVEREGSVAVPAKIVADFVASLPAGPVTLSVQNNTLSLKSSSSQTTVLGFDTAEYPIIPKIGGDVVCAIPAADLKSVLSAVAGAAAVSENRPELSGVFISFQKGTVTAAATDSFRLAEKSTPVQCRREETVIVPRVTALEVSRMCDQVAGDVSVRISENQISFSGDDVEVVSRLIDGRYPDYRKIIPERSVSRALVDRAELGNAVRLASLFSSNIADVTLECAENILKISAKNSAKGDAVISVPANLKGEAFEVSLNHHYLNDGVGAVSGNHVVLEFTGKGSPFVLRMAEEPKDTLYLVMPLRS